MQGVPPDWLVCLRTSTFQEGAQEEGSDGQHCESLFVRARDVAAGPVTLGLSPWELWGWGCAGMVLQRQTWYAAWHVHFDFVLCAASRANAAVVMHDWWAKGPASPRPPWAWLLRDRTTTSLPRVAYT